MVRQNVSIIKKNKRKMQEPNDGLVHEEIIESEFSTCEELGCVEDSSNQ